MSDKICKGCAEKLQTTDSNGIGFVPFEKYILGGDIICKRCFRLKHYSEIPKEVEDKEEYIKIVTRAMATSDISLCIFDAIDLEASMTTEILDLLEEARSFVVLNKIDLLPKYFTVTEIAQWFKNILVEENVFPEAESYISTKSNFGINGVLKKIKSLAGNKKEITVAVIGASNVGKSSLLNRLLGKKSLTVSKFSGTTKGSVRNSIKFKDVKITFVDTPGLIPNGRLSDMLNPKTGVKLVPNGEIPRKTFRLKEGQYFMFSNLMYFKANKKCEIQVFASKNVEFHVTNENKYKELLTNGFFKLLSDEETSEYMKHNFVTEHIEVEPGMDLSISGLGFIELKKGEFDIDITYPEGVNVSMRNSISKLNKQKEDDEFIW